MSTEKNMIGVHFGNEYTAATPEMFPANNWIGAQLLHGLLKLALAKADLLDGDKNWCFGHLSDCIFAALVNDETAAIEAIKEALRPICTALQCCQIGVYRPGAGWVCVHPSSEMRMAWLMDTERQGLATQQFTQAMQKKEADRANLSAYLKKLMGRQGDQTDGPGK